MFFPYIPVPYRPEDRDQIKDSQQKTPLRNYNHETMRIKNLVSNLLKQS